MNVPYLSSSKVLAARAPTSQQLARTAPCRNVGPRYGRPLKPDGVPGGRTSHIGRGSPSNSVTYAMDMGAMAPEMRLSASGSPGSSIRGSENFDTNWSRAPPPVASTDPGSLPPFSPDFCSLSPFSAVPLSSSPGSSLKLLLVMQSCLLCSSWLERQLQSQFNQVTEAGNACHNITYPAENIARLGLEYNALGHRYYCLGALLEIPQAP